MYADVLVLICETMEEARFRFVAWRNALESKGLKVNISKMKVMKCARDVVPMEAAVDPCSVYGKRVGVNSVMLLILLLPIAKMLIILSPAFVSFSSLKYQTSFL